MNKVQTKKLISYKLIVVESQVDRESLALVPKFSKGINRLGEIITAIESIGIKQKKNLLGITIDKDNKLVSLTSRCIEFCGAIYSYAHEMGNNTLMSRVKYKASVLKNMSQAEIVLVASVILEEALLVPADKLLEEGIDAEDIALLRDLKNDFNDLQSEPKEAIIDRSESTEKLSALFSEANSLVKNSLDKLAIQYKRKAPEFYRRYRIARGMATTKQSTAQKPVTEPDPVR